MALVSSRGRKYRKKLRKAFRNSLSTTDMERSMRAVAMVSATSVRVCTAAVFYRVTLCIAPPRVRASECVYMPDSVRVHIHVHKGVGIRVQVRVHYSNMRRMHIPADFFVGTCGCMRITWHDCCAVCSVFRDWMWGIFHALFCRRCCGGRLHWCPVHTSHRGRAAEG